MLVRIWRDWLVIFLVLIGSLLSVSFNNTTFVTANQPEEHSPSDVTSECIKSSATSFINSLYFEPYKIFWGGNSFDTGRDIALDKDNNILISGIDYASGLILVKFSSNGTYLWNTTIPPSDLNIGYALEIDSTGHIYVAGIARAYSEFAYLWKFSPDGDILWNYTITGSRYLYAFDLSLDSNENIIVIGDTFDELPSHQIFIYKLTPDGNVL